MVACRRRDGEFVKETLPQAAVPPAPFAQGSLSLLSLPCVRGGGFCEAKLGGVVKENNLPPADAESYLKNVNNKIIFVINVIIRYLTTNVKIFIQFFLKKFVYYLIIFEKNV